MAADTAVPPAAPARAECGRRFSIAGVPLMFSADSDEAMASGTVLLEHFGLERRAAADADVAPLRLTVARRPPPPAPTGAAVIARHLDLVVRGSGDRLRVDDGRSVAEIELADGVATLYARSWPAGPAAGRPYLIVVYTLLTLLRRRGLVPLHGAAVERRGGGVLLVAPSGSGKSTMSLMLLRRGWRVVSDDSVLLRLHGSRPVRAHGLRRDLFLRTPERDFPDLADHWRSSPELERSKRRFVIDDRLSGSGDRACTPRCILLPELVEGSTSRLLPCPADEVLFRLLDHSTIADLETGAARGHVEVLGELVRQTRSFVLEAAADLLADPDRLHEMLEPVVAGGEPRREATA